MKKIFWVLLICIFLSACNGNSQKTEISLENTQIPEDTLTAWENQEVVNIVASVVEDIPEEIIQENEESFSWEIVVPPIEKKVSPEVSPVETFQEKEEQEELSEDEKLRLRLSDLQYEVTQNGKTETPYENPYWNTYEAGIYVDIIDGTALFSSTTKYDTKTGWPSFTAPISEGSIAKKEDSTLWFKRTEVLGKKSSSHLGHVFTDGPQERWGLRYCINSAALRFIPQDQMVAEWYKNYMYLFEG